MLTTFKKFLNKIDSKGDVVTQDWLSNAKIKLKNDVKNVKVILYSLNYFQIYLNVSLIH
jgi:uncharacterized membrane protein YqhA